jgi:Fe-coproporphyrin III synthase
MCDIWKANNDKKELSESELRRHVKTFKKLGVREIVFSGGEALMHSNLWSLCELLGANNIRLTLLSTGLLLEKHAKEIVRHIDNVIISLDGSESVHDKIRNVPSGYKKIKDGITALKSIKPDFKVTGRCVVQKQNYLDLLNIVRAAKDLQLDAISFLAADVSSSAFNHIDDLTDEKISEIALGVNDVDVFEKILADSFTELGADYKSRFISESPEKMQKIAQYYRAINRQGDFPASVCNAPWVSAVIESNGDVKPCFFHRPYGNIYESQFIDVINSREAVSFRRDLNMAENEICKKCVCSLKLGLSQMN